MPSFCISGITVLRPQDTVLMAYKVGWTECRLFLYYIFVFEHVVCGDNMSHL
jgi:hypothetical protein